MRPKHDSLRKGLILISLLVSRVARLIGFPIPLVIALMVLRSSMFKRSVRWAYVNRDLATPSGRLARRQRGEIENHWTEHERLGDEAGDGPANDIGVSACW